MAAKSLTFEIFGKDKSATKTLTGVQKAAQRAGKAMQAAGRIAGVGLAVAGAAAVKFGVDSVKAFAAAEKSENELIFALKKFPKTADTNVSALKKLNTELMKKSRFDDDAIASGEAVLAQYELTGAQIMKLMPLIVDYAAKTGKDIPEASKAIGKALLGQGRALKDVGIDFKDTGSLAGNFDSIVGDLSKSVGGFAKTDLQTANGKLENMRNRFGEVQEKVGQALMPTLERLMEFAETDLIPGLEDFSDWFTETGGPALEDFIDWLKDYKDVLGPAAAATAVLTAAAWGLNIAMAANPVGLIILALGAVIAVSIAVAAGWENMSAIMQHATLALLGPMGSIVKNWEAVSAAVAMFVGDAMKKFKSLVIAIGRVGTGVANAVLSTIRSVLGPLNELLALANLPTIKIPNVVFSPNAGSSGGGGTPPKAMAEGGVVRARPGGIFANIGEGRHDEAVIPLTPSVLSKMGGGGGTTIVVHGYVGSENKLAQEIQRVLNNGRKRGAIA